MGKKNLAQQVAHGEHGDALRAAAKRYRYAVRNHVKAKSEADALHQQSEKATLATIAAQREENAALRAMNALLIDTAPVDDRESVAAA